MRQILLALTVTLVLPATASAQSSLRVVVGDGLLRAEMRAADEPYTADWPRATLPARA